MVMKNNIYAILPCYNEALNITDLIQKWNIERSQLELCGYILKIVVINDCSTDNSTEVVQQQMMIHDNLELVEHAVNKGLCGGLNTALAYFSKHGTKEDLMVLMDGDNTHNPCYVHGMVQKVQHEKKDCVIASRYCDISSIKGVAKHREFLSDMARYYYTIMLRVPGVKDYTCGYRVYNYDIVMKLLRKFGDDPIKEKSFACMMELLYRLFLVGARFDEVGFELRYDNKQGESKMKVLETTLRSITTAFNLKKIAKAAKKQR